jgi:hypothetical protein
VRIFVLIRRTHESANSRESLNHNLAVGGPLKRDAILPRFPLEAQMQYNGFIWRRPSSTDVNSHAPKLAPADGFWTLLKLLTFTLFGFYNISFFWNNTHGWLRYATCAGTILLEVTIFLISLWWSRTVDAHRKALFIFGIAFILISATHATIGYWQMQAGSGSYDTWMSYYLHVVAFPLIFGGLAAASIIVPSLHWEKRFVREQVEHEIQIEKEHSKLRSKIVKLEADGKFKLAELSALRRLIQIRGDKLTAIQEMIRLREKEEEFIEGIDRPELQDEARQMLTAGDVSQLPAPPVQMHRPWESERDNLTRTWRHGSRAEDEEDGPVNGASSH